MISLKSIIERFAYSPLSQEADGANERAWSLNRLYLRPNRRILILLSTLLLLLASAVLLVDSARLASLRRSWLSEKHEITNNAEALQEIANNVDWSRFAYVQYVTNLDYLCNSLMLFATLEKLGCRSERLLMHPLEWTLYDPESGGTLSDEARLLRLARDKFTVSLQPIHLQSKENDDPTWADSYTKLLAMNQTLYDRVLSLDSDSTVLQCLDELFLLPSSPVAMPRAYWLWNSKHELSSQLLLVEPKNTEFTRVMRAVDRANNDKYDMDILNDLYMGSAMVLPHRDYDLLTGEFNGVPKDHSRYLGSKETVWDPVAVLNSSKFLHFSDFPIPKPWIQASSEVLTEHAPKCYNGSCVERDLWYGFYGNFQRRRKEVCNFDVVIPEDS